MGPSRHRAGGNQPAQAHPCKASAVHIQSSSHYHHQLRHTCRALQRRQHVTRQSDNVVLTHILHYCSTNNDDYTVHSITPPATAYLSALWRAPPASHKRTRQGSVSGHCLRPNWNTVSSSRRGAHGLNPTPPAQVVPLTASRKGVVDADRLALSGLKTLGPPAAPSSSRSIRAFDTLIDCCTLPAIIGARP